MSSPNICILGNINASSIAIKTVPTGTTSMCNVVWDESTCQLKRTPYPSSSGGGITGATNGICAYDSHNVCLGGALCGINIIDLTPDSYLTIGHTYGYNLTGGSIHVGRGIAPQVDNVILRFVDPVADISNSLELVNTGVIEIGSTSGATQKIACFDYQHGWEYYADYSTSNTTNPRWIPDKEYVDTHSSGGTSGGTTYAGNGLTKIDNTISLGGTLTGNTTFDGSRIYTLNYANDVSPYYTCLSIPNAGWVTGKTSGLIISANKEVIFNSSGSLVGHSYFTYNCTGDSLQVNAGSIAIGNYTVAMITACACANYSFAVGVNNQTCGDYSAVIGGGTNTTCYYSLYSAIIGGLDNTIEQHGNDSVIVGGFTNSIYSCDSAIIGGTNNTLNINNDCSVLLGGSYINVPANLYSNTVIVPNLAIVCTPAGSGTLLAWDNVTCKVCLATALTGLTGTLQTANNGLSYGGGNVTLGGTLTGNRTFDGSGVYTLNYANDVSSYYTCLSIPNVGYVTGKTSGLISATDTQIVFNNAGVFVGSPYLLYCTSIDAFQVNIGSSAICQGSVAMINACACSNYSIAVGTGNQTYGDNSAVIGGYYNITCAGGGNSGILGGYHNCIFSTNSAIIGGYYNYLQTGNDCSVILGGQFIEVGASCLPNTVIVPNLAIWNIPTGTGNYLCWNPTTYQVCLTSGGTGGGATITATDKQIIFNTSGTYVGSSNFTYNCTGDSLQVNASSIAIGGASVAMAGGNAIGNNSIAMGSSSYACGSNSFVIGVTSSACGNGSIAMGNSSYACGVCSIAMGGTMSGTYAIGDCSVAIGGGYACGVNSFAVNYGKACGMEAISLNGGVAIGDYSFSMGSFAYCQYSISMGNNNTVCSNNGAAIGGTFNILNTGNTNSVIIGGNSIVVPANLYPNTVIVPNLSIATSPSGAGCILCWNPTTCMVEQTTAGATPVSTDSQIIYNDTGNLVGCQYLQYCHAIDAFQVGIGSSALGTSSVAMSYGYANSNCSVAMVSSYAWSDKSFSIIDSQTCAVQSFAAACSTTCGVNSVALACGYANGYSSVAMVGGTTCAYYSFAVGLNNVADAYGSVVIGGCGNTILPGENNSVILGTTNLTGVTSNSVNVPNLFAWTGDVEVKTIGCGFILKSPNGSRWRIAVDNSGNLSASPA